MTTKPRVPFVAGEHGPVGAHLKPLASRVKQEWPDVKIGTSSRKSGGGEITLCFCKFTVYVRKHLRGDTWNFNCRRPGGRVSPRKLILNSGDEVVAEIRKLNPC